MNLDFNELGYRTSHSIKGRYSIADLFKPNERCGIYILGFENGQHYVGQAKDVVRRYSQHRKNHHDISDISFKRLSYNSLNEEEKYVAQLLQSRGYSLRNIQLVSIMEGDTDFDGIMSAQEQEQWLSNTETNDLGGEKFNIEEHRLKYTKNFQSLCKKKYFVQYVSLLAKYIHFAIPSPIKSEYSFWSVSCPSYGNGLLGRVNINWQEVSSWLYTGDKLWATFHLAETPLIEAYGHELRQLQELIPSIGEMTDKDGQPHRYAPGGQDQICLTVDANEVEKFLELEPVRQAIRVFNMRLIRKGATIYTRYHCFDLSDVLLSQVRAGN